LLGYSFTTAYNVVFGVTLRLVIHFVVVSRHQQSAPPSTSVINSLWSVAAKCIALAAGMVRSRRWSLTLAQEPDFCLPHLHSTPSLGGFPSEYCHYVLYGNTRMVWLPDVKKMLTIRLFVLTESTNVTDRQTDRRTNGESPHDGIGCAYAQHRAAIIIYSSLFTEKL